MALPFTKRGSSSILGRPIRAVDVLKGGDELRRQAARVLNDYELMNADLIDIQERAHERIEELKIQLSEGQIGPRELDAQFTALWFILHFETISAGRAETAARAELNTSIASRD